METQNIFRNIGKESNTILLWIAKDYGSCRKDSITSPLAKGESIALIVNDVMNGLYPNVIALWYNLDDKKVTLAFRKEGVDQ